MADADSNLFSSLSQFLAEFFKELDLNGENVTRFYVEGGVFSVGGKAFVGHDAINGFYAERLARVKEQGGMRTSRHTFVNLRISDASAERATLDFINLTYAGDGAPPVLGLLGPSVVSDCRIACRRGPAGSWLIERFDGEAIFIGSDPVMNKMLDK